MNAGKHCDLERSLVPEYLVHLGQEWVDKPAGGVTRKRTNGGTNVIDNHLIAPRRESITCVVSILDVSGFTKLSEGLCSFGAHGADYLFHHLNEYFRALINEVTSMDGDVLKFAGDALIITWRCDSVKEHIQALRAIRASLNACALDSTQMQKHGHSLAASETSERRAVMEQGFDLKAHVGLAFGELDFMVLGGIGGRHEFLVSGDILEETGTALDAATTKEVVVSPKMWSLIDSECKGTETKSPGFFRIDGLEAAPDLYSMKPQDTPTTTAHSKELSIYLRSFVPKTVHCLFDNKNFHVNGFRTVSISFLTFNAKSGDLQNILTGCQKVLVQHGGMLRQFIVDDKGCVLIAGWGLPSFSHQNDEERAVRASIEIHANEPLLKAAGVTTGKTFCGFVGSDQRKEYAIVGDIVNLAARLMSSKLAPVVCEKGIFDAVTDGQNNSTSRDIEFKEMGKIRVKGKTDEIAVFAPTTQKGKAMRSQSNQRQEILLNDALVVGREKECQVLTSALYHSMQGEKGVVVTMEGPAGFGKSTLSRVVLQTAEKMGKLWFFLEGNEQEMGANFFLLHQLFQSTLLVEKVREQTATRSVRRQSSTNKVSGVIAPQDMQRSLIKAMMNKITKDEKYHQNFLFPALAYMLRLDWEFSPEDPTAFHSKPNLPMLQQSSASQQAEQLVINAVSDYLKEHYQVFAIDDCQFYDSMSLKALGKVAHNLMSSSKFILLNSRKWSSEMYVHLDKTAQMVTEKIVLSGLDKPAILSILEATFKCNCPADIVDAVHQVSAGNPFWVVQLSKSLHSRIQDEKIQLDNSEAVRHLLNTDQRDGEQTQLEKCIVVQFDTLNSQQQEILKVAAIIGTLFRSSVLKKVLPMSFCRNHDFNGEMEALEEQRILYRMGDELFSFNHDLSRTVIASLVPMTKQSKLHNQAAKAYERLFRDDLRPYYSRLAYHYDKCGEAEESFTYLKLAAISALQIDSIQKAIDMLNRAMFVISNSKLTSSDRTVKAEQLILLLRSSLRDAGVPVDATGGSARELEVSSKIEEFSSSKYYPLIKLLKQLRSYKGLLASGPVEERIPWIKNRQGTWNMCEFLKAEQFGTDSEENDKFSKLPMNLEQTRISSLSLKVQPSTNNLNLLMNKSKQAGNFETGPANQEMPSNQEVDGNDEDGGPDHNKTMFCTVL